MSGPFVRRAGGLLVVALIAVATQAQTPRVPADGDPPTAIQALEDAFRKAFDAGDPKAAAATFTPDALVILEDGQRLEGRDAIERGFAEAFADAPGATIAIQTDHLKILGPDSIVAHGVTVITPEGDDQPAETSAFTVVYARRDGKWLQAYVRDEPSHTPEPTPHQRLLPLAWMLGEWVHEDPRAVIFTSCRWDDDGGNYLIRSFTIQVAGQPALKGTQRIGWNPLAKQFESWVFDTEGGMSQALWTRLGDEWLVKATGVRADGRSGSSTQIITPIGSDRIRWRSLERTEGMEVLPGIEEVVLVRKPPKPGS